MIVAFAAGIAAMLSFESGASAAVGVAISVTTIPASAYLGVAIGGGGIGQAGGALAVLAVNVALLILSGILTLLVQRILPNRSGAPVETVVAARRRAGGHRLRRRRRRRQAPAAVRRRAPERRPARNDRPTRGGAVGRQARPRRRGRPRSS